MMNNEELSRCKRTNAETVKHNFFANCKAIKNRLNNHLNTVKK